MKTPAKKQSGPLSREDKDALLYKLRKALLARGYRQLNPCLFEGTTRHGTFQVFFTACSVEKQIQRCEFERKPGTNHAWARPDHAKYPYWWDDYGFGWLNEISVDDEGTIRGMVRYRGSRP